MKAKRAVADYFTFSRKDRLAAVLLAVVVGGLLAAPSLFPDRPLSLQPLPDSLWRRPADSFQQHSYEKRSEEPGRRFASDRYGAGSEDRDAWRRATLFAFDPNNLDAAGWSRLGLPGRTVQVLLKYRERGGRFRRPDDLRKIWSLPDGFVDRVLPFIRLPAGDAAGPANRSLPDRLATDRPDFKKRWAPTVVSINEADSAAWEALPGIGAKLAARITRYRDRLGGFQSVEQVGETFGLPDSTFQSIRPRLQLKSSNGGIRKLNLNTATKEELKLHPYIRWNLANAIVEYRQRHGAFASIDDLKKLLVSPDSTFRKLAPYVTAN